ncbi:ribokinase [Shouchella shacheensis]|uniref:ribokinase n=1 Tax=Shouchella shacheensis TaxID=1649580 RepID=UPI0007404288|nr:ribokinase [Shouchella shacheensis]
MNKPKVTVVGSINMDMVTTTDVAPKQGETVLGTTFAIAPGGKGANQAVAAARLGAEVRMVGCVGDDAFGSLLLQGLQEKGIAIDRVERVTHCSSGVATIVLSNGDNRIIITPGANKHVNESFVANCEQTIAESDIVLVQLEIPLEAVKLAIALCAKHQVPVILNPAPAQTLPEETLQQCTYITPNETEQAELFAGGEDVLKDKLIVTKGVQGVIWSEGGRDQLARGYQVDPVDTTGAGDTFNGALAVALAEGRSLAEAVSYANAAAALSVQAFGAQGGMPTEAEVFRFLQMVEGGVK